MQIFDVSPLFKVTKPQLNGDQWKCTYPVTAVVCWMPGVFNAWSVWRMLWVFRRMPWLSNSRPVNKYKVHKQGTCSRLPQSKYKVQKQGTCSRLPQSKYKAPKQGTCSRLPQSKYKVHKQGTCSRLPQSKYKVHKQGTCSRLPWSKYKVHAQGYHGVNTRYMLKVTME